MSKKAKQEYLEEIRQRYFLTDKAGKKQILDEFCAVCCYNRKYAIRCSISLKREKAITKRRQAEKRNISKKL